MKFTYFMDILKTFNWIDVLVITLLIRTCYIGTKVGFTIELQKLTGLIVGFIAGYNYYKKIGLYISGRSFLSAKWAEVISLLIVMIGCIVVFKLATILLSKIIKLKFTPQVEKVGGGISGCLRGIFLASVIFLILGMLPSTYLQDSIYARSLSGGHIVNLSIGMYDLLSKILPIG